MKRRTWILGGMAATGALVVGWGVMPARSRKGAPELMQPKAGEVGLNGWLKLTADNHVVLAMPRSEMGQGVHTALAMLVAEELDLDLRQIRLEQASADKIYGNVEMFVGGLPLHPKDDASATSRGAKWVVGKVARELGINATGGSSSVVDAWGPLRQAAAMARGSLLGAASLQWKLPVAELSLARGVVSHASGKTATFAELAQLAAITPPASTEPKARKDWKLLGTPQQRTDTPAKVFGTSQFGIDVRPDGLLYATVKMAPALGGQPGRIDAAKALAMPGARRLVQLPPYAGSTAGFAVVGTSYWHALQAANAVEVEWRAPPAGVVDTDSIETELRAVASSVTGGFVFHERGDPKATGVEKPPSQATLARTAGDASGAKVVQSTYYAPYLAHATMEPMNCTARVRSGRVDIWAPTQVPQMACAAAAAVANLPIEQVHVHVTQLGGGFGRRLEVDFVAQAVRVAMDCDGKPVQLLWSREQDTAHDFYRPAQACHMVGVFDGQRKLTELQVHTAGDAITPRWLDRTRSVLAGPVDTPDKTTSEGLFDLAYNVPHQRMRHTATQSGVPVGFWRAVGHSQNAFFKESFIDELAHAARVDPLQFRLDLLSDNPRHQAVLKLAAEKADWAGPLQAGRARGIAIHQSFGTIVAQVVEVSEAQGSPRVHRVVCAVDCGVTVNPNVIAQQMEGCVVFGLSAALYGSVDIRAGQVQQNNFNNYRVLAMAQTPIVETHMVASDAPPGGIGEPGLPPIAPAVANAWFALTAKRLYRLPFINSQVENK